MFGHRGDELAGQPAGLLVAFGLGQMALEDGVSGALPEVGLEDRREGEPATAPAAAQPVSRRRHRRGR
jgi:hypothetical protein